MNFAYQLLVSVPEILFAIGFLIFAKRIRINVPKITIKSAEATGSERISSQNELASEEELLKLLITNGVDASGAVQIKDRSSEFGIIYHANLSEQNNILKNRKTKIKILSNCRDQIQRQVLSCTPDSGFMLAHLIDGNVEIVQ